MKSEFDYYYGAEAEQFSFVKIPKVLFSDKKHFGKLSIGAKLMYGLLLDRMSLSRKNNWIDNQNRVYIVFLKQNPTDAAKLQDVLNINDSEIQFVNDVPAGHGLLILGGKTKIPFYDEFPKDTKLYSLMTTNFSETAKMLHQNEDENNTT